MPAGIWSFLQAQFGFQTLGVQSDSKQQDLNGKDTGAFEALITEYTGNEDAGQEQANNINPKDDAQVLTLRTSSFSGVKFVADGVEDAEAKPSNSDTWRNLFADTKRVMNVPSRRQAEIPPQNDFDEGVTVIYDEPEAETLPHVNMEGNEPEFPPQPEAENYSDTPKTEQPDFSEPKMNVKPEVSRQPSSQPVMAESVSEGDEYSVRYEPVKQEAPRNETPKQDTPQPVAREAQPTVTETQRQEIPKAEAPDVELPSQELPPTELQESDIPQPVASEARLTVTETSHRETPKVDTPNVEPTSQELPRTESPEREISQPVSMEAKPAVTDTPHQETPKVDTPDFEPTSQEMPLTESPEHETSQPITREAQLTVTETPHKAQEPLKVDTPDVETTSQKLPVDELPKQNIPQTTAENSNPIIPESPKTDTPRSAFQQTETQDVPDAPRVHIQEAASTPSTPETPETYTPDFEPSPRELPVDDAPKPDITRPVEDNSTTETLNVDAPEYSEPDTASVNQEAPQPRTITTQPSAFTDTDDVHVDDAMPDIETEQNVPERSTEQAADVKPAEARAEDFVLAFDTEDSQTEPSTPEAENITLREPVKNVKPELELPQSETVNELQPEKPEASNEVPEGMRPDIPTSLEPHEVKAENVKPEIASNTVKPEFDVTDAQEKPNETPHVQDTEAVEPPKAPENNESNNAPIITKPGTDTDTVKPDIPAPEVQPEHEMTDMSGNAPKPKTIHLDSNDTPIVAEPDNNTGSVKPEVPHVKEVPIEAQILQPEENENSAPNSRSERPAQPRSNVEEAPEPSENHEPSRTQPRVSRTPRQRVEARKAPETPANESEAAITSAEIPQVTVREVNAPEVMSVPSESVTREAPASDRAYQTMPENREQYYEIPAFDELKDNDTESPEKTPEAPDADFVMAGFAQVQPAQNAQSEIPVIIQADHDAAIITPEIQTASVPETPRKVNREEEPEISPSAANVIVPEVQPEITDTPSSSRAERPSRTQPQSTRRTQAVTQEVRPEITDYTQPQGTEFSRTLNQPGHEGVAQSGTPQPSQSASNESGNDGLPSTERIPVSSARTSRSTSRTDSRTETRSDTRRNEALSDFQSFFDSVTRVKRTASRVNTRPISLRTGTYEVSGTQSQGRTLRNGIVNVVRFIRSEGVRKANIVVDPPALGRITVELTSGTSGVEASVKVASEQIRQIIQNQLTQLRDNLLQQGVQVSEFTVDVQQDNSGQGRNSGNENQRSAYSFTASDDDDETENFRADIEEGLLYWIA